ncbi:hypothetical protein [Nocardioides bruguierae]|uniref:hypothetical protein n=1 Tax=Nocardioides bruguierae TaxID=2945102 RepID=UPI0020213D50|nr:hypothetical protein [Nocardioides bruguierae]MCL8026574.1 hypothetical protein [Nocardioides bruguierae]
MLAADPTLPTSSGAVTSLDLPGASAVSAALEDQGDALALVLSYVVARCSHLEAFGGLTAGVRAPYEAALGRATAGLAGAVSQAAARARDLREASRLLTDADDATSSVLAALETATGDPAEYSSSLPHVVSSALATGSLRTAATASQAARFTDRWKPLAATGGYATPVSSAAAWVDLTSTLDSFGRGVQALQGEVEE